MTQRATHAALSLFTPFKWYKRAALRLAHLTASLECQTLLSREQVVVASKAGQLTGDMYLCDWLCERLQCRIADVAVYSGWSRPLLQLLDESWHIVGIAKLADMKLGRQGIERENSTLRDLSKIARLHNHLPRILVTGEWQGHAVQVQTANAFNPGKYTGKLTPAHLDFLTKLSQIDRCEMNLVEWPHWSEIWQWAHEGEFVSVKEAEAVRAAVERCALKFGNIRIPFHRVHGDFAPWNVLSSPNGLIVVDWEFSEAMGLPLFDAVHFGVKVIISLRNMDLSLHQLLCIAPSTLGMQGELNSLASSISLSKERRFTRDQMEALTSLCIIVMAIKDRLFQ